MGRHRRTVAKERASLHRRQHRQLRAQPDLRLQRVRTNLRFGWCRRRRLEHGRLISLRRRRGSAADVRQRARWPDLVAPPGGRGGPRRRTLAHPPLSARRRPARRVRLVGRHAPDVLARLRLRQGDLPSVLHGRDGTGSGSARRRRRRRPLASRSPIASLGLGAARHHRRRGALGRHAAGADVRLRLLGRADGRGDRARLRTAPVSLHGATEQDTRAGRCRRHRGRSLASGRARGVLADNARDDDKRHRHRRTCLHNERGGWSWWRRWLRRWRRGHFGRRAGRSVLGDACRHTTRRRNPTDGRAHGSPHRRRVKRRVRSHCCRRRCRVLAEEVASRRPTKPWCGTWKSIKGRPPTSWP